VAAMTVMIGRYATERSSASGAAGHFAGTVGAPDVTVRSPGRLCSPPDNG